MSFWKKLKSFFTLGPAPVDDGGDWVVVRNRDAKGQFKGDDKSTPDVDEAYVKVKKSARGKFKDTDPKTPGVQNSSVKKTVAKKRAPRKTTKTAKK